MTLAEQLALKAHLPRTWPAFFERYGSFTEAQRAAIPPLLAGENLLLSAPTASGKTAAVLAPLVERYCPPVRAPNQLRILYLTPTRALVNDLQARLTHPLQTLGVRLGVRTSDSSFARARPPDVLLTTPESLDALLASNARLFARLQALVIDELHIFDAAPRGDQVRALLARLRRVRSYAATQGDAPDDRLQCVALSATLANPAAAAGRYLGAARVVEVAGGRAINAEFVAFSSESDAALHSYLATFRARGWRKALAFCNSRLEVERYAAAVRAAGSFGGALFTHYSNLDPQRRREIEQEFASAEAALCFTSSTLELGIDVGNIDVALLIGPPGNTASFAQRLGRANRRSGSVQLACCYRTPLERLLFQALLEPPVPHLLISKSHFRPSVAVQQIFSLIKQSPYAAVRLPELSELFTGLLDPPDLRAIVGELTLREYLVAGRPGEWRAGPRLNKLYDEQASPHNTVSIHSNIQVSAAPTVEIRDQLTGRPVARVEAHWLAHEELTLEGKRVQVQWADGEALWVTAQPSTDQVVPASFYRSGRQLLGYELARLLPVQLGLLPGEAPFVGAQTSYLWFHWLGDLYGRALLDLLRYTIPAEASATPGLALLLPEPLGALPTWSEAQITRYLHDNYRQYEALLDLGPFHHLLTPALRRRTVVEQFDLARFEAALAELRPVVAPEALVEGLGRLV